jgi:hypothetical protein
MNTDTFTHRIGHGAAILIGFAIVLSPVTVHASETGVTATDLQARFVSSDLDPRGRHVARQLVPTGPDITDDSSGPTLRQLMEADRGEASRGSSAPTLRQLMEADR